MLPVSYKASDDRTPSRARAIFEHDQEKVVRVFQAFCRSASKDLRRIDRVAGPREWQTVGAQQGGAPLGYQLSPCRAPRCCVCSHGAGLHSWQFFAELYQRRRSLIVSSLDWAEGFLNETSRDRKLLPEGSNAGAQ